MTEAAIDPGFTRDLTFPSAIRWENRRVWRAAQAFHRLDLVRLPDHGRSAACSPRATGVSLRLKTAEA